MRTYTKNLETGKIELRFDKSDYMSMSADDQRKIKSNFLFSSRSAAWVSRASNNTWAAEAVCKALGATFEGEMGERLSFGEKVARQQEKAEDRAERLSEAARKAETESTRAYEGVKRISDFIPMGQPILVGHHSERHHRRDIERMDNGMRKSVGLSKKAEYYSDRAQSAEYTASGVQYTNPAYLGNRIKETEAKLRELNRYLQGIGFIDPSGELCNDQPKPISQADTEHYENRIAEETEKLNFFKEKLAACGVEIHTKESLKEKRCTHVLYGRIWYPVKSYNAKSVTVLNWLDIARVTWSVEYTKIKGIKTLEDMHVVVDRDGNEVKPTVKIK